MKIKRNTIQRCFITEVLDAGKEHHISAERMFEIVSKKHPMIGRATVYRNLAAMAEDGKLRRIEVPGGPDCFDTFLHDHHHIRCSDCRSIFDVDMKHISLGEMHEKITDKRGFLIEGFVLAFHGTCPKCQESQAKRKKNTKPSNKESVAVVENTVAVTETTISA